MDVMRREMLKLHSGSPYGKSILDAARAAYISGETNAKWPEQMPTHIDAREDKRSWM